MTNHVSL